MQTWDIALSPFNPKEKCKTFVLKNVFATVLGEEKTSQKYLNDLLEMVELVYNQGKLLFFPKDFDYS